MRNTVRRKLRLLSKHTELTIDEKTDCIKEQAGNGPSQRHI